VEGRRGEADSSETNIRAAPVAHPDRSVRKLLGLLSSNGLTSSPTQMPKHFSIGFKKWIRRFRRISSEPFSGGSESGGQPLRDV